MIESVISSSHHFYVIYIEASGIHSVNDLLDFIKEDKDVNKVHFIDDQNKFYYHAQIQLNYALGSENILQQNKAGVKNGKQYYWYDLYLGEVHLDGKKYFFLCYPYNRIGKILDEYFTASKLSKKVLKPDVNIVLDYMKNRGISGLTKTEIEGFLVDITKYSAEIKEEIHANRINIIGNDPLNSRVFDLLSQDDQISIEALSLRLKCVDQNQGTVELAFDRLGNFRFWLKRDAQSKVMPILPISMQFFTEIKALKESSYINSFTLLEDEQ